MPPKAAKRRLQAAASGSDDPRNSADDRPKKSRTSKTSLGEYDEDPGRKASKQFHRWGEWQKVYNAREKTDKRYFADTLKAKADNHRKEIASLLNKTADILNIAGEKHANALREACAVNSSTFNDTSMDNAHEIRQISPLFKTGQQLLQFCHDLITTHEKANRKVLDQNREIIDHIQKARAKWNGDMTQLDEVLRFGLDYGAKIVECSVSASISSEDKSQILAPDRSSFREAGQTVLDMYQKSTGKLSSAPTWGEGVKICTEKMLALVAESEKMDCI